MIELLGLLLGVVALAVGVWHIREIRIALSEIRLQAGEAKSHTEALDAIRLEVSTRYIAPFPDYFPQIVEILKTARRQIVIFCDFPGYGSFTDPDAFLEYRHTIERKIQADIPVYLTCLDAKHRTQFVREQFLAPNTSWESWKAKPENDRRLLHLLENHGCTTKASDLSSDAFIRLLEEDDSHFLAETFKTAIVREVDVYMPLYYWLVDETVAVFSIPSLSERAIEYGFITRDQKLIAALGDMRVRYHRSGAPPEPSTGGGAANTAIHRTPGLAPMCR